MERVIRSALLFLAAFVFIGGCASLGVPTPQTFNERAAASISVVTEVRSLALTLLQANKISVQDAENVQKQADNAREGIVLARTLHAQNAASGESKLNAVQTVLTALRGYLATKGGV